MNPEEGELGPQLLDRFGLCVRTSSLDDPEDRVRLMELRERFDANPAGVRAEFAEAQEGLRRRLVEARLVRGSVGVLRGRGRVPPRGFCAAGPAPLSFRGGSGRVGGRNAKS